MTSTRLVIVLAALVMFAAAPADARVRHKQRAHCNDRAAEITVYGFFNNPKPQPNGCAQPVYSYGEYVGQDPDPNVRLNLLRDPVTGYSGSTAR
jgi:hypothetical protein